MKSYAVCICFGFVVILQCSFACFITTCPMYGKKRSEPSEEQLRKCMACGPDGIGECYGPNVCCHKQFGCYIGYLPETAACRLEKMDREPCVNTGAACGVDGSGFCATRGFCCTETGCSVDSACEDQANRIAGDIFSKKKRG